MPVCALVHRFAVGNDGDNSPPSSGCILPYLLCSSSTAIRRVDNDFCLFRLFPVVESCQVSADTNAITFQIKGLCS